MRYLKIKVARARQIRDQSIKEHHLDNNKVLMNKGVESISKKAQDLHVQSLVSSALNKPLKTKKIRKISKSDDNDSSKIELNSARNVVKNYGRAMASFCLSEIALLYLKPLIIEECVQTERFKSFMISMKESIDGIASLRSLLLAARDDDKETIILKRIFQKMCVVFIKNFSVNWIFGGRLKNKIAHLKCRFRMLRRVLNPQHFTYMKT